MPWTDGLPEEVVAQIPEELRGDEALNQFNSLTDLAKGYKETKSMVGQSIRIPSNDAGDEVRGEFVQKLMKHVPELMLKPDSTEPEQSEEFYRLLGKPEAFDKYENPEGAELPAEVEAELRQIAFNSNMTNGQYQRMITDLSGIESSRAEAMQSQMTADMEALKGKWGQAYPERVEAAKRANEELYGERPFDTLTAADIEAMYNHHAAVTGKPAPAANQSGEESGKLTPDEARRRADEIMKNPAYWDKSDPQEQQRLIDKRLELLEMAGGTRSFAGYKAG